MSLAESLSQTVDAVRDAVPPDIFAQIGASIDDLQASGQTGRAAQVGAAVALPVLATSYGAPLDLAEIAAGGPIVLTFYRGGWCPYCNVTLRAFAQALPQIEAAGGKLVAITPELPAKAEETAARAEAGFAVAVDRGNDFARALGLVFALPDTLQPLYRRIGIDLRIENGDDSHELPIPATYVLDRNGIIVWAFVNADFTKRAEPADVVAALQAFG
jgi:peroxiredoxin